MALAWDAFLPPSGAFTTTYSPDQPSQRFVHQLTLSPGSYPISVLPDLIVLTRATCSITADDFSWFLSEDSFSSRYIGRALSYYRNDGEVLRRYDVEQRVAESGDLEYMMAGQRV